MAPTKRAARSQKTKSATKRPRLSIDVSKKERVERSPKISHGVRTRSSGPPVVDVYSPNISTSEFSEPAEDEDDENEDEDEDEDADEGKPAEKHRLSLLDDDSEDDNTGKRKAAAPPKPTTATTGARSTRQIRAARRLAERAHEKDLTDDEEDKEVVKTTVTDDRPPKSASSDGNSSREIRARRRLAEKAHELEVDLTDDEEEQVVNAKVNKRDTSKQIKPDSNPHSKGSPNSGGKNQSRLKDKIPVRERAKLDSNTVDKDGGVEKCYPKGPPPLSGSLSPRLSTAGIKGYRVQVEKAPVEGGYGKGPKLPHEGPWANEGGFPTGPMAVESDSSADADGETDVEASVPNAQVESQDISEGESPEPSASAESEATKKPVQLEDIDFTTGAAARYIEFMKQRGLPASELFGSTLSSSSSSSSSDSESSSESGHSVDDDGNNDDGDNDDGDNGDGDNGDGDNGDGDNGDGDNGDGDNDDGDNYEGGNDDDEDGGWSLQRSWQEDADRAFMNEDQWGRGDDKSKNGSNDSTSGQNVTAKYALATVDIGDDYNHGENSNLNSPNDSYLVFPRDKTIDGILSGQLRAIGQTLNFIVRAQASGIEVGDFDSLAAVKPEQWAELVEGPDYAADVVVKSLLDLSMWDICILSEHSKTLRKEMEELGVVI